MDRTDLLSQLRFDRDDPGHADVEAGRRWKGVAAAGALLFVVGIGVVVFRAQGGESGPAASAPASAPASEAAPQTAASAAPATARPEALLQATGYVAARREATVSAQITGMLVEVRVEEGDRVEAGQVIALLDSKGHSASLRAAEAGALAAQAEAEQIEAEVEQGDRKARRQVELLDSQLVSREMAEQAQTELATAQARLRAARRRAESAHAQLQSAGVAIGHTEVKAPFGGVVIHKAAQIGEIVSPQSNGGFTRSGICTIVDMDSLEVDVDINEAFIGRVAAGMPAEIVLDAYPDWRIAAHVVAIVPTADRGKATVRVRVGFDSKDPRIIPDMGARVSFLDETRRQPHDPVAGGGRPASATAGLQ